MIVSPASRMLSAISFGRLLAARRPRRARSSGRGSVSPGFDVMRTTIWSDSTRVPPVTAERSPPDSRMTGADSPVIADSSTDAMPSTTSPSPGMTSPGVDDAQVADLQLARRASRPTAVGLADVGHRLGPGLAQRVGLRLAAAFGHRLGEVGEQHREPQPRRDEPGEHAVGRRRRRQLLEEQDGGEDAADLDDEHDRVAGHLARVELARTSRRRPAAGSPGRTSSAERRGARPSAAGASGSAASATGSSGVSGHRCAPQNLPTRCSTTGPSATTGK